MTERIVVRTKEEFEALPREFPVFTVVEIRTPPEVIIEVRGEYHNAHLEGHSNAHLAGYGNAHLVGYGNAHLVGYGNAHLVGYGNAHLVGHDNARLVGWDNARLEGHSNAHLAGHDNAHLVGYGNARLVGYGNARLVGWDNARLVGYGNARLVGFLRSTVVARSPTCIVHIYDDCQAILYTSPTPVFQAGPNTRVIYQKDFVEPSFEEWLSRGWVVADGITQRLISRKRQGEVTLYKTEGEWGEESWVAQKGDKFAHGKTTEEAIRDLRYKISDRDTSKYSRWKLTDEKPIEELIEAYRAITGACSEGTKIWCESGGRELKGKYTVAEAIEITQGAYGSGQFAQFFKGR